MLGAPVHGWGKGEGERQRHSQTPIPPGLRPQLKVGGAARRLLWVAGPDFANPVGFTSAAAVRCVVSPCLLYYQLNINGLSDFGNGKTLHLHGATLRLAGPTLHRLGPTPPLDDPTPRRFSPTLRLAGLTPRQFDPTLRLAALTPHRFGLTLRLAGWTPRRPGLALWLAGPTLRLRDETPRPERPGLLAGRRRLGRAKRWRMALLSGTMQLQRWGAQPPRLRFGAPPRRTGRGRVH